MRDRRAREAWPQGGPRARTERVPAAPPARVRAAASTTPSRETLPSPGEQSFTPSMQMLSPVAAPPGGGGAVSASFAELADFVERQQMLLEQHGRQDKEQQRAEYEIAALQTRVAEHGSNFSSGQRPVQLFSRLGLYGAIS